jgi:GntR family transcriptional regulator / MocR family aminotransferase
MVAARSNLEPITSTTLKRRNKALDVPLGLDRTIGNQSLQVHASLRGAILDGRLAAGLRLPSSRSLADQLSVRRNAIVGAYELLLSDGLV